MTGTTRAERVVTPRHALLALTMIVFAASAAMTIVWCESMAAMGGMPMPGGWTMSHMWMPMPRRSWLGATASFAGMWVVMMAAMMLPSLTPTLLCYRESAASRPGARPGRLTALVGLGYFAVWAALGLLLFASGVALADIVMREPQLARAVPMVVGTTVLVAGVIQRTAWKARHLALRQGMRVRHLTPVLGPSAALRHGLRLGVHCAQSCAGLTAAALALGVMDIRVMAVVTAAITVERLAPNGVRVARATGIVGVGAGLLAIARATGLG